MPLHRRLPKRGFTNIFKTEYQVVNLSRLASWARRRSLRKFCARSGVITTKNTLIKVLGRAS